ncbi:hypothetical protein [Pseudoalteromonas luteoviolacea]|uniref:Uncharacterized protein n=1 Tax=Pseudoalteromonas luteoviolacea NCIMB 1942 TaxID=1365253 RepID=A0A161YCP2_9GAMM|nr:hypothetical protein [Pseudoalteromonas luteoviolacea]KZN57697.1 hypothetical protein N482_23530 [Pseudoalteromonas luteoviolacea NCIMB 1942]
MLNTAAACSNTQTTTNPTLNTIQAPSIQWIQWLSKIGRSLQLSYVVMHK